MAFLSDPASYSHHPKSVEAIETHMSRVFLAGALAFKMKRAVRLPFVDFTSLEARRLNSEREVALNQRLAPGIYEAVVPVTRGTEEQLAIGGAGEPCEWLVRMRRLDRARLLDCAILSGEAKPADIDRLTAVLAGFYAETARIEITAVDLLQWWREALTRVRKTLTSPLFALPAGEVDAALGHLERFLANRADLIFARAEARRIVDGHGDLRPEHVHLGPPLLLIDRLEFSERLRWADPFDESALLGLECERLGAPWMAPLLVDGLAAGLGESPPPALHGFYRCYRACLRSALSIEHLQDPQPRTPERWPRQANEYLSIAAAVAYADQS